MKVYVVVVNHHPANAPQNYKTECQIFLDKKEAEGYKKAKEEEYPIRWEVNTIIVKYLKNICNIAEC